MCLLSGSPFSGFAGPPGARPFALWPQQTLGKGRILSRQPLFSGFLRTEIFDDYLGSSFSLVGSIPRLLGVPFLGWWPVLHLPP